MGNTIVCLSGVSGTGKTHYRTTQKSYKDLPYVDIADIHKEQPVGLGAPAVYALWERVKPLLPEHPVIVIEGYFLRNSLSRAVLNDLCQRAGARLWYVEFWEEKDVCARRIHKQVFRGEISREDADIRIEMMERTWRPKNT